MVKLKNLFSSKKETKEIEASSSNNFTPVFQHYFNGEKNPGELGPLINYELDFAGLRRRSWESYLTSEITQTIVKRFVMWVIGKGLHLQCEPSEEVLKSEGINGDLREFTKKTEARFNLYLKSKNSTYSHQINTQKIAKEAFINAIVGGDVLIIQRVEDGVLNTQIIDGIHVQTPYFGDDIIGQKESGTYIENGIEMNARKEHIAFYVKNRKGKVERIRAKGKKTGYTMAFMVYGLKYRPDDNRGMPLFSCILETLKKIDRYKEAAVGSAEERAKIVYQVTHGIQSTGENPMLNNMVKARNADTNDDIATDVVGKALADNVALTTNKQTFNMPVDSELKALQSDAEDKFVPFYQSNIELISSVFGMPPELAFMKYESNYSSSRAAIKDWEHTLKVWRDDYGFQFYQPIYCFWLRLEILKGKIQAPGYLQGVADNNFYVVESYEQSRFVGSNVPHIDPVKEVKAERLKLGITGEAIPLTTAEASTERLGEGDFATNRKKYAIELEETKAAGIEKEKKEVTNINTTD
ncbi:phage portal protein [uncultured Winogradskyella sp.]|uniref:phage portal protein n=1 Tax=uncultured Winogradskyella sp. TaxID=395353 RepID=UPI0030EDE721